MQLLVLALMLMGMGNNAGLKELKPILEEFGGDGAAQAIKQAEELSGMLNAIGALMPQQKVVGGDGGGGEVDASPAEPEEEYGYPLAPIAAIADDKITYCLSRYIAMGE